MVGVDGLSHEAICDLARQAESRSVFRSEMLRRLSRALRCEAGIFHDSGADVSINARCLFEMDEGILRSIQQHWVRYAQGLSPVLESLRVQEIVVDADAMKGLERSDFYQEIMRPHGWDATIYAHVQLSPRHQPTIIALSRVRGQREVDETSLRVIRRLLPVISLADAALVDDGTLLDPEERKLAQLVSAGYTNRQIGAMLRFSVHTIRNKLAKLFVKYGITSRAELAHRFGRDLL